MADTKRKFFLAALAIIVLFGATAFSLRQNDGREPAENAAETARLSMQQKIFAEWFALYQRDVEDLSRNWQIYHHIIDMFKTEDMDAATCYERLSDLAEDERTLLTRIEERNLPPELDEFLYGKARILRDKISEYGAAQYKTIALSRAAADPDDERFQSPQAQSAFIQEIMIRQSPTNLFIADEVYAVREYLSPIAEAAPHE